jgi:hypothetical protein
MTNPDDAARATFRFRTRRDGTVTILWSDRPVTTLRGVAATRFLMRVQSLDADGVQLEMARVTGNFKRGNERLAEARERRKR